MLFPYEKQEDNLDYSLSCARAKRELVNLSDKDMMPILVVISRAMDLEYRSTFSYSRT